MSAAHDRQFTDMFTLVVGVLVGIAFGIYFLANYIAGTQTAEVRDDARYQEEVALRIAPVGKVAVSGRDNSALEIPVAPASAAAVSTAVLGGEEVYNMACVACHGAGIAGAPKFGDKAAWASHLAKGIDVLHQSALNGIQGTAGVMPAKGGRVDLSDQSVINAVDYMVGAVR